MSSPEARLEGVQHTDDIFMSCWHTLHAVTVTVAQQVMTVML